MRSAPPQDHLESNLQGLKRFHLDGAANWAKQTPAISAAARGSNQRVAA
jgi:hypothetical protein